MCGICGIIKLNNEPVSQDTIQAMVTLMERRGPDDSGEYFDERIGLGFTRLSILDLSKAGHQPMVSDDARYVIVFNGEIYNYLEIRKELSQKGYSFNSNTDTEVLLKSYIEWGGKCLDKLNGMFAFFIYDSHFKTAFGARDRFGIKPFYYFLDDENFIFASDIPPILEVMKQKPGANEEAIFDYLVYNRTNHNQQTFFDQIYRLPAGHALQYNKNQIAVYQWYELPKKIEEPKSFDFKKAFLTSLNLQMRSDVPVGCCLSGGLDSTAITYGVLHLNPQLNLHTFSAVYGKGQSGDESEFIEELAHERLNMHYTYPSAASIREDLNSFLEALSEPVPNTSEYAEFKVMQLAKDYCTVILNGQGADEILGGYHYFYGYFFRDLLHKGQIVQLLYELWMYIKLHKSFLGIQALGFALFPKLINNFDRGQLSKEFLSNYRTRFNPLVEEFYSARSLQSFMINHFKHKFEHHLLWADKSGMYFSLETRFPFLDHHLVEQTLASKVTIKNGYTKHLMREALKGILPEKIRTRTSKDGFNTPEASWLRSEGMQEVVWGVLNSNKFAQRGYFNAEECRQYYSGFLKGKGNSAKIWKWVNLELWFNKYID